MAPSAGSFLRQSQRLSAAPHRMTNRDCRTGVTGKLICISGKRRGRPEGPKLFRSAATTPQLNIDPRRLPTPCNHLTADAEMRGRVFISLVAAEDK